MAILETELIGGPRDGLRIRIDPTGGVPYELFIPVKPYLQVKLETEAPTKPNLLCHVYRRCKNCYRYVGYY